MAICLGIRPIFRQTQIWKGLMSQVGSQLLGECIVKLCEASTIGIRTRQRYPTPGIIYDKAGIPQILQAVSSQSRSILKVFTCFQKKPCVHGVHFMFISCSFHFHFSLFLDFAWSWSTTSLDMFMSFMSPGVQPLLEGSVLLELLGGLAGIAGNHGESHEECQLDESQMSQMCWMLRNVVIRIGQQSLDILQMYLGKVQEPENVALSSRLWKMDPCFIRFHFPVK